MTGVWSSVIMGLVDGHSEQMQCPCARVRTRHAPGNDGPTGCGLFRSRLEDCAEERASRGVGNSAAL